KVVFGWEDLIYRLGEKLFKDIEFETKNLDDIFLPHKVIEQLSSSLIHIIRNAIDHGIETPAEREKIGKSPKAKISVHATESDSEIVLKITDDGKGINPNKIIEMAKKKAELGLISKIYIDKLIQKGKVASLLFCSGFSTAQEVSNISGRGIGMGAVHSTIQELSGSLKVQSKQGKGTSIIISIPKLDD
ncbi:MAG: two-component system chemotaxis sensor kinase CheA, partial [bacterium]